MTINQISVFIENKAGKLSAFTHLLREQGIDIRALSIADVEDYGILRIIVDDVYKTSTVLKNNSCTGYPSQGFRRRTGRRSGCAWR